MQKLGKGKSTNVRFWHKADIYKTSSKESSNIQVCIQCKKERSIKITVFTLALMLSGCVNDLTELHEPLFSSEIKGNYSALARCVADTMEANKRWSIRALQYDVRVYPDIEKSEIKACAHGGMWSGVFYAFYLELNQTAPNVSNATLKGLKYEGGEALIALQGCAEK